MVDSGEYILFQKFVAPDPTLSAFFGGCALAACVVCGVFWVAECIKRHRR